ncbi:MAG: 3-carboxymuconate cyclase [Xanthobacteraceae bacterium]|nr:3-carboxymuconate cyclase [Xanthobacteraceae bacterium]
MKAVFYQSIGPELARYDIDVDGAALTRRDAVTTPGANVQYVWPHPSKKFLYVVSSNGGPGTIPGTKHIASAFRIDPASGALTPHGAIATLPSRPVHCSVDRSGEYLLTAYNYPSNITVHRIKADGTIGEQVPPREKPDAGIFAHQVLTTPGNKTAILVTRGNNPEANRPEDPGALKIYGFRDGVLSNLASVQRGNGLGFGPRHFDIHPNEPWLFLSVERQSELHVYRLNDDSTLPRDAMFIKNALANRANQGHTQMAGAIHIHPNGRFGYMTNRNSGTEEIGGRKVFKGGENNVAVFSIDQASGEPTLIQNIEARTVHLRTFAIDPAGRLLIAASVLPMAMRDGGTMPAALVLYRIGADGRLEFARKYDVDTGRFMQFWTGIVTLP